VLLYELMAAAAEAHRGEPAHLVAGVWANGGG
jgi:hypothetical protein